MDHRRCSTGRVTPFQAGGDETHAVVAMRAHSNGAGIGQKSFMACVLAYITPAQKSRCPESSQSPAKWPWGT